MNDARSFAAWLRRERERRSITLRSIADRTKIGAGLLEALERGDVSRWPGGIYRRAFIRGYASAVGLDVDLVVADFERVFPSDPSAVAPAASAAPAPAEEMRLALVAPPVPAVPTTAIRTVTRDVACVLLASIGGWAVGGATGFWCAAAIVALTFHLAGLLGVSLVASWKRLIAEARPAEVAPGAEIVNFSDQQARATSRRARARRLIADLSSAAGGSALAGRRRAARS